MYTVLILLHVVLCIVLIVTILLQAGRGGGLTEMMGGDTAQSVLGTQAPVLLKKITTISAVGFIVTSMVLGMVTARRGRSLFESPIMHHTRPEEDLAFPFTQIPEAEPLTERPADWPVVPDPDFTHDPEEVEEREEFFPEVTEDEAEPVGFFEEDLLPEAHEDSQEEDAR